VKLKRLVYILIFTIGLSFTSFAQNRSIDTDPVNMQQKMIKTYPNPASVVINFSFQHSYDKSYTIEIYNFIGKKVQEFKTPPSQLKVNLDNFYRGVYIYQLRDKFGSIIESGKFQVIK